MIEPEPEYLPGDLVQLKSGGPIMTVTRPGKEYSNLDRICVWFDKEDKCHEHTFPQSALKKAEKGSKETRIESKPIG